jgi:hypothetical protein
MARGTTWRVGAGLAALLAVGASGARADDAGKGAPPPKDAPAPTAPKKYDGPVSGDDAARAAIERFEREFKAVDQGKRMNALNSLSMTKNDLVTKKLGTLLANPDPEVRMAAASCLDSQFQNPALSGEILRKALAGKKEDEPDVLIAILQTIGRIHHPDAIPEMGELVKTHADVWVKIEALKSFGKMKDRRALLPILELWLVNPHGYSWEGGEESVDTGAPGDADQKAAEQKYKEKHKNSGRRGAPPVMLKTYIQAIADAVEKICGEKVATPTALMQWLVRHEAELGFKLPAMVRTTLKEFEERAAKRAKK